jgi:hypothetical protein
MRVKKTRLPTKLALQRETLLRLSDLHGIYGGAKPSGAPPGCNCTGDLSGCPDTNLTTCCPSTACSYNGGCKTVICE